MEELKLEGASEAENENKHRNNVLQGTQLNRLRFSARKFNGSERRKTGEHRTRSKEQQS